MKNCVSCHKAAFRCFRRAFLPSLFLCTSQVILWLCFIYGATAAFSHLGIPSLAFIIPCISLLLIYRFFISHRLALYLQPEMSPLKSFPRLIPAALWRFVGGAAWLFPFAAVCFRFYQYIFVFPATTFTNDFTKIGAIFAQNAALSTQLFIGSISFFTLLAITFVIFLYGWRKGICFDIAQTADLTFEKSLRKAHSVRKVTRKARAVNTLLHSLILLPAIIFPLLLPMMQLRPLLTGKAMNDIQLIYAYLKAGIVSDNTLLVSACIFLALYLPWLPFRKLHNIAILVICHE